MENRPLREGLEGSSRRRDRPPQPTSSTAIAKDRRRTLRLLRTTLGGEFRFWPIALNATIQGAHLAVGSNKSDRRSGNARAKLRLRSDRHQSSLIIRLASFVNDMDQALWRDDSMEPLGEADQALDRLWRGLYGEPLPLRGAPDLALRIILETERPPYRVKSATPLPGGSQALRLVS